MVKGCVRRGEKGLVFVAVDMRVIGASNLAANRILVLLEKQIEDMICVDVLAFDFQKARCSVQFTGQAVSIGLQQAFEALFVVVGIGERLAQTGIAMADAAQAGKERVPVDFIVDLGGWQKGQRALFIESFQFGQKDIQGFAPRLAGIGAA